MRYPILICFLFIAILGSCKNKLLIKSGITKGEANENLIDTSGRTIEKRIACLESFSRIPAPTLPSVSPTCVISGIPSV